MAIKQWIVAGATGLALCGTTVQAQLLQAAPQTKASAPTPTTSPIYSPNLVSGQCH